MERIKIFAPEALKNEIENEVRTEGLLPFYGSQNCNCGESLSMEVLTIDQNFPLYDNEEESNLDQEDLIPDQKSLSDEKRLVIIFCDNCHREADLNKKINRIEDLRFFFIME